LDVLVAQPPGRVTPKPRKLANAGPDRDIDMEPSMQAHDRPARAAKQGFAVVKVKKDGRRSPPAPPDRGPEASKRRDAQVRGSGSDRTTGPCPAKVKRREDVAAVP
jgi:hypothetical protein